MNRYSSNTATARIGPPEPYLIFRGKSMKRIRPLPINSSRLHKLSMRVMPNPARVNT